MIDLPPELNTPEFQAAWLAWEANKRETRSKHSDRAKALQIKKLLALDPSERVASIYQSIEKGWATFYHVKHERHDKPKSGSYEGLKNFAARAAADGSMHKEFGQ
jgi:hypothetical protein